MRSFSLTVERLDERAADRLRIVGRVGGGPLRVGDAFTTVETHEVVRTPSAAASRVVTEEAVRLVVLELEVHGVPLREVSSGSVARALVAGAPLAVAEGRQLVGTGE